MTKTGVGSSYEWSFDLDLIDLVPLLSSRDIDPEFSTCLSSKYYVSGVELTVGMRIFCWFFLVALFLINIGFSELWLNDGAIYNSSLSSFSNF